MEAEKKAPVTRANPRRTPPYLPIVAGLLILHLAATISASAPEARSAGVDFSRDVLPILADRCFRCHGPDGAARQAELRLDRRDDALAVITSGDAATSELWRRITALDPDDRMPPASSHKTLAPGEIELLRQWIDDGAAWSEHWAFRAPAVLDPPAVRGGAWPRNDVDRFVLARLEAEGLAPSPEAPREALLRRVSFDLTGLPPTIDEIDAFLADEKPGAYERVVDRLLASPRYGERMAMTWLDAARYADTHGYHYDNEREMWRWRDWVIDACNRNLPFDRFTIEQLAGDLLPEPTLEQQIATGFNRNHGITWEGGIIPEEYRLEYVADRANTTAMVWMGLTMGCARCHDHKFDPITQREFYEYSAFFNTIPEQGNDGLNGNAMPFITAPDEAHESALGELDTTIAALEARYEAPSAELDAAFATWEESTATAWRGVWTVLRPFSAHSEGGATLRIQDDGSIRAEGRHPESDTYEIVTFTDLRGVGAIRVEAMADERLPRGGPGRASHANFVLSELEVEIAPVGDPSATRPVTFTTAHADHAQPGFFVTRAVDGQRETGWAIDGATYGEDRVAIFVPSEPFGFAGGTAVRVRLRQDSNYTQHAIGRVRLAVTTDPDLARRLAPSSLGPWHEAGPFHAENGQLAHRTPYPPEAGVSLTALDADGAPMWRAHPTLADRVVHTLEGENASTYLYRTITAPTARFMRLSFGSDDAIKAWINGRPVLESDAPRGAAPDQNVVDVDLERGRNDLLVKVTNYSGQYAWYFDRRDDVGVEPSLALLTILNRPEDERTDRQRARLRASYRMAHSPEDRVLIAELETKRAERAALLEQVPTVMVMAEMETPRRTFMLARGRYDQPGEEVRAGVPGALSPLPAGAPPNRLGLARWLTDPTHPLTARVAVNRYWQMHFGRGLVQTPEDFGTQGARPTHPALLDWLARAFVESGWDVKAMHRLIVTSATYRQDARVTPAMHERDPDNLLLARGPRFRLPAEMIRDAALAASGLLVERRGGPSVKPYQPEGLWKEVGSDFEAFSANVYRRDAGEGLYRRSLYTFWKRTLPPPSMQTFDAPSREYCVVRRSRTNTPLQALVLLNDPTYVEASRFLAQRVLLEAGADPRDRAVFAFRTVTSRRPSEREIDALLELHAEQHAAFAADAEAVQRLLGVGDGMHEPDLDRADLAAWAVVASVLLNLDETITKG
jgi:hypothetical protein